MIRRHRNAGRPYTAGRATLVIACQLFGVICSCVTYAQSLVCTPASDSEKTERISRPNTYVLLHVFYPDGQLYEVVLYSDALPATLASVGAIDGPPKQYPVLLSKDEANKLMSTPIRFKQVLNRLTSDLAPQEACPLGGVVRDSNNDVIWGSNIALDDVLEKFFVPMQTKDGRLVGHELRKDLLLKLTCADIAALLKCNVSVQRSASWSTIIVRKQPAESRSAQPGCDDELSVRPPGG